MRFAAGQLLARAAGWQNGNESAALESSRTATTQQQQQQAKQRRNKRRGKRANKEIGQGFGKRSAFFAPPTAKLKNEQVRTGLEDNASRSLESAERALANSNWIKQCNTPARNMD